MIMSTRKNVKAHNNNENHQKLLRRASNSQPAPEKSHKISLLASISRCFITRLLSWACQWSWLRQHRRRLVQPIPLRDRNYFEFKSLCFIARRSSSICLKLLQDSRRFETCVSALFELLFNRLVVELIKTQISGGNSIKRRAQQIVYGFFRLIDLSEGVNDFQ